MAMLVKTVVGGLGRDLGAKCLLQAEEVGHGHVTYARTRFSMEISV